MPLETELRLYRDSLSTPWGFRLHGGKDLNAPLTVQKVSSGTPADGELKSGDVIITLQGSESSRFTHLQAQEHIRNAGGSLLIRILRYGTAPRAPQPLIPTYISPPKTKVAPWKKPSPQEYGVDYARQSTKVLPLPVAVETPSQPPQPGFMLSRVKDTLSGVSGESEGYPLYKTFENVALHSPSLYQPLNYTLPTALAPEAPAWAGSLRAGGQALDSDKHIGPRPHSPKVQTIHHPQCGATEQGQQAPTASHDLDTVRGVHLQYNSPLGLYSKTAAQDALHSQLQGKPGEGTIKILSESEVSKANTETDPQGQGTVDEADVGQSDF